MIFVINQLNAKTEHALQFLREVNFFCPILCYKNRLIYQQLNIKYLKKTAACCSLVLCHFIFALSLTRFAYRNPLGVTAPHCERPIAAKLADNKKVIDSFCFSQLKRQKLNFSSA